MCSTCDFTKFVEYNVTHKGEPVLVNNKTVTRLKSTNESIDINCDMQGKNYKIGNFTIYRCPTCGAKLF